ncbi:reverse transcriptase domain-containing protein [Tanacetum coccineum]
MPFGLKNAGATYQRLVDGVFRSQIGKNLEVYVDDMVVKSRTEREMPADIAETFDNLKRISMKLNPKKCSFGVTEGKFLGKGGGCFPETQEDDLGSTGLNNPHAERNLICIPSGITRSGERSAVGNKARKATSDGLCQQNTA